MVDVHQARHDRHPAGGSCCTSDHIGIDQRRVDDVGPDILDEVSKRSDSCHSTDTPEICDRRPGRLDLGAQVVAPGPGDDVRMNVVSEKRKRRCERTFGAAPAVHAGDHVDDSHRRTLRDGPATRDGRSIAMAPNIEG